MIFNFNIIIVHRGDLGRKLKKESYAFQMLVVSLPTAIVENNRKTDSKVIARK